NVERVLTEVQDELGKLFGFAVPPDKNVGVQKRLHRSPSQNSSGKISSKSLVVDNIPRCKPATRRTFVFTGADAYNSRAYSISPRNDLLFRFAIARIFFVSSMGSRNRYRVSVVSVVIGVSGLGIDSLPVFYRLYNIYIIVSMKFSMPCVLLIVSSVHSQE